MSNYPTPAPSPADASRELPPVRVDGHALFEFSLQMNRALKELETRFPGKPTTPVPYLRQSWKPTPRKPR
jgi:hypothetical protein